MVGKRLLVLIAAIACVVGIGRVIEARALSAAQADTAFDLAVPHDAPIPQEALRLRIIANSDSSADQQLKLRVRDAIVVKVAGIVRGAQTAAEAKRRVLAALPAIRATALGVMRSAGSDESVAVDVGRVPFPTKVYGNLVYPAGTYDALRITLGAGKGQNWWCVLFPPLCFIDIADGDAVPNTAGFPDLPPLETLEVPGPDGQQHTVQVRLAALDYGEELWRAITSWWQRL